MNTTIKHLIIAFISTVFLVGIVVSCSDKTTELELPYLFRPINFTASLSGVNVTFSWAAVEGAQSYTIQVSQDSLQFSNIIATTTTTNLQYTIELAGSTHYSARVKANASDTTKSSKYNATLTLKTPAENLFTGYGTYIGTGSFISAYMTEINSLAVKWLPGANVTHFILTTTHGVRDSIPISSNEAAAGTKIITGLNNAKYTIKIYNGARLRGTTTGLVEGDYYVTSGSELTSALGSYSSGQVIVLAPGTTFALGSSTTNFNKNVKIRGVSPSSRSTVCMGSGASTSATMLGFTANSAMDSICFENIDFTGYTENSTSGNKIGYLFNNSTVTTVGLLKFTNCYIHNFGNTQMRLQGSKGQRISQLTYLGCVIYDIGFANTYAVVNINSADFIDNITFTNCTVYYFQGAFILRTGTASAIYAMSNVSITNCSFNQGVQDTGGTNRIFFDFNYTTISGGISIKNCIFGSTKAYAGGLRTSTSPTTTITGNYYTTDYIDTYMGAGIVSYSIQGSMTSYSGTATSLWNNPASGDFTLKDASFAGQGIAGDLRWY